MRFHQICVRITLILQKTVDKVEWTPDKGTVIKEFNDLLHKYK